MIREDKAGAIGKAGELWVAGNLLLQGTGEGYRVFQPIVDEGVDLFLGKYTPDGVMIEACLQVKICTSAQGSQAVYTLREGNLEGKDDIVFIFLYAPEGQVEYCWVMKGGDVKKILGNNNQIRLSVEPSSSDRGSEFRCEPRDLLEKLKKTMGKE